MGAKTLKQAILCGSTALLIAASGMVSPNLFAGERNGENAFANMRSTKLEWRPVRPSQERGEAQSEGSKGEAVLRIKVNKTEAAKPDSATSDSDSSASYDEPRKLRSSATSSALADPFGDKSSRTSKSDRSVRTVAADEHDLQFPEPTTTSEAKELAPTPASPELAAPEPLEIPKLQKTTTAQVDGGIPGSRSLPPRQFGLQPGGIPGTDPYQPGRLNRDPSEDCKEAYEKIKSNTIDKVSIDITITGEVGTDIPYECTLTSDEFTPRQWNLTTYTWKASALCHKPLYFEQVALERYGHSPGPVCEYLYSFAHFFGSVALLPYNMGVKTPCECEYALGYYRPGNCAPYMLDPFPISLRGAVTGAAGYCGVIALFP